MGIAPHGAGCSRGFFGGGWILGSGKSLSRWLENWMEIRDRGGEKRTEEGEKPFVHVLFFSQGGKKEEDTEG